MIPETESLYFALLAGPLFVILMRTRFPTISHVGVFWTLAFVWMTFILLANVSRFIGGDPAATERLASGSIRWGSFILSSTLTLALWERWQRRGKT